MRTFRASLYLVSLTACFMFGTGHWASAVSPIEDAALEMLMPCGGQAPGFDRCGSWGDLPQQRWGPLMGPGYTPWASGSDFTGTIHVTALAWPDPWLMHTIDCRFVEGLGGCHPATHYNAPWFTGLTVLFAEAKGEGEWQAYMTGPQMPPV